MLTQSSIINIGEENSPTWSYRPECSAKTLQLKDYWESDVNIGDRFRIGTAEVMATAPRLPCYKLGIKFGRPIF